MKTYFRELKAILKKQTTLYFVLLIFSAIFIFRLAFVAFFRTSGVSIDWVTFAFFSLFVLSFILQSLLLRKKCYPLFLFRVLIVILLGFQVGYRIQQSIVRPPIRVIQDALYSVEDAFLGFRMVPDLHDLWQLKVLGEDTLSNVCFSSDRFCRRIPDSQLLEEYLTNPVHPSKHALFFGCSNTFGFDLMYSSTFPYLFEKLNPDYKSYNYGVVGLGPHQIALMFDKRVNIINEEAVPEEQGFALYTFIDDHLNRVYGGSVYLRWSHNPSNVYIENDSLVIKEWPRTQLICAKVLNQVNIFMWFKITLNYPKEESFYQRFASIINYTAKKYWEVKPGNHFYVGLYPGLDQDLNWTQYLDERIIVLRMDVPLDYDDKSKYEVHKYDYHPSGAANVYYAEELTKFIKEHERHDF